MRRLSIILSLLVSYHFVSAQLTLDANDISGGDSLLNQERFDHFDKSCKLRSILNSTNTIEIRLYEFGLCGLRCRTFCFDGNKWSGKAAGIMCFSKDSLKKLNPAVNCYKIFDSLTRNNVFELQDQSKLHLKGSVDDGSEYSLLYKVGNKFRSYEFSNPDYYGEMNPEIKELKNYETIVKMINALFISH